MDARPRTGVSGSRIYLKLKRREETFRVDQDRHEANLLAGRLSLEVHRASDMGNFLSKTWKLQPRVAEPLELLLPSTSCADASIRDAEDAGTTGQHESPVDRRVGLLTVDAGEPIIEVSQTPSSN
ncbi:MAG: hypothetical protein U0892_17185 [Pirellulales bacterium]